MEETPVLRLDTKIYQGVRETDTVGRAFLRVAVGIFGWYLFKALCTDNYNSNRLEDWFFVQGLCFAAYYLSVRTIARNKHSELKDGMRSIRYFSGRILMLGWYFLPICLFIPRRDLVGVMFYAVLAGFLAYSCFVLIRTPKRGEHLPITISMYEDRLTLRRQKVTEDSYLTQETEDWILFYKDMEQVAGFMDGGILHFTGDITVYASDGELRKEKHLDLFFYDCLDDVKRIAEQLAAANIAVTKLQDLKTSSNTE